jgi:hypothetical protein
MRSSTTFPLTRYAQGVEVDYNLLNSISGVQELGRARGLKLLDLSADRLHPNV